MKVMLHLLFGLYYILILWNIILYFLKNFKYNNARIDPVEDKFQCYELQHDRKNFPALVSLYKPLWSNRKYGEEFGDALKKEEKINIKNFYHFKRKLKLRKKTRYDKRDTDMYNYLEDYENFDEEYDF